MSGDICKDLRDWSHNLRTIKPRYRHFLEAAEILTNAADQIVWLRHELTEARIELDELRRRHPSEDDS